MHFRLLLPAFTALVPLLIACETTKIVTRTEVVYQTNQVEIPRGPEFRPWGMIGARIADTFEGTKITQIITNSAAELAGLKNNDILLEVGAITSGKTETFVNYILHQLPGTILPIRVRRTGRDLEMRITVGAYPADEQLYLMAKAAMEGMDFSRAGELLDLFEALPKNAYSERAKALRERLPRGQP